MPRTRSDWLHFTKELVLKLLFLSVVGTETEWVYWASKKMREALQSPPEPIALKAVVWQSWMDRVPTPALLDVKSVQLLRQLWL